MAESPCACRVDPRFGLALVVWATLSLSAPGTPRARAGSEPSLSLDALRIWQTHNDAGWNAYNRGDYRKADLYFRLAIDTVRNREPANDRRLLARSYHNLARVYFQLKRFDDAEPLARWALTVRETTEKSVTDAARFESNYLLGVVQLERNAFADSESLLRRALKLQERNVDPNDRGLADTVEVLAEVCVQQRKFAEAESLYRRSLGIREKASPVADKATAETVARLAGLLRKTGREDEAERLDARAKVVEDEVLTRAARTAAPSRSRGTRNRGEFQTFHD